MKLKGIIAEVGTPITGIGKESGKEWKRRTLSLLIPYYTERGEEKYDNIVADFFGDAENVDLTTCQDNKTLLQFTVSFTTYTYNGRRYQSARVWNLSLPV